MSIYLGLVLQIMPSFRLLFLLPFVIHILFLHQDMLNALVLLLNLVPLYAERINLSTLPVHLPNPYHNYQ